MDSLHFQKLSTNFLQHSLSFPLLTPKFSARKLSLSKKDEIFFSQDFHQNSTKADERHELPVYGTYIHKDITPGFRYKVRENGTNKMFFKNKALCLENTGQGYGKRITFESDDILENENFFWSDSNPLFGYSFFIQALFPADVFTATMNGKEIGLAVISEVEEKQFILSTETRSNEVQKDVKVSFKYALKGKDETVDNKDAEVFEANGIVSLVKRKSENRCKVFRVQLLESAGAQIVFLPRE